jgi:hypothetical protein
LLDKAAPSSPIGVSQNESVHPQLESQPSPDENPESQQTLVQLVGAWREELAEATKQAESLELMGQQLSGRAARDGVTEQAFDFSLWRCSPAPTRRSDSLRAN